MNRTTMISVLFAAALAFPTLAVAADYIGTAGTVVELEVNQVNADAYLQFHGRVVILAEGRVSEYRWGGTNCSNKALTENQVTMLQRALESGTVVTPRYQSGQGNNKCVVGFTIQAP